MIRSRYPVLILCALVIAFLMAIYPISYRFSIFRPEWVSLIVLYWLLYRPEQMGVGRSWLIGLCLDMVEGVVWGGHALGLAFISYICQLSYRRLRSYPLYQQCVWVFILVGVHQIFVNWIQSLAGYSAPSQNILISSAISALIWPIVVMLFQTLLVKYRL